MKKILTVLTLFITLSAFSQSKNAKATLFVDGVCGMCKARIEKGALKTKGVKSANWNVKTKKLSVIFNEEKTTLETITKKVASVGHDTRKVKATDDAYATVHPCCKYRDKKIINDHK